MNIISKSGNNKTLTLFNVRGVSTTRLSLTAEEETISGSFDTDELIAALEALKSLRKANVLRQQTKEPAE